jgi:hypothetical protein
MWILGPVETESQCDSTLDRKREASSLLDYVFDAMIAIESVRFKMLY